MDSTRILSLSDILRHSRPLTGAAFLHSACHASPSPPPLKRHKPSHNPPLPSSSSSTFTTLPLRTLTPIPHPTVLVGTIHLPTLASPCPCGSSLNRCLLFSDATSKVCVDLLEFDIGVLGKKVRVLGWNFVPFKKGNGGVLEIIRWEYLELGVEDGGDRKVVCSSSFERGMVRSVSPVFAVPCNRGKCGSSSGGMKESVGFIAELGACECASCRKGMQAKDRGFDGDLDRHCFSKTVFVYFCASSFSWHPVVVKLVGRVIEVLGLKKKNVFVGEEEPYIMLVSRDETVVSRCWFPAPGVSAVKRNDVQRFNELVTYAGVVTAMYMNGMVVELDEKVWLLLTDPLLAMPHSVRVGALISVRNVYIVSSNLSWIKVILLGSCTKTTLDIKSFSLFDARSTIVVCNQSLLGKFINSLIFSARFWVLLLVSCFTKKFLGLFSDKDILGSKQKKGLAQIYAMSCLPPCVFRCQNGIFMEFCKHDDYGCRNLPKYPSLELVAPLSDFFNNCKEIWMSILLNREDASDVYFIKNNVNTLFCEGHSYDRLVRQFISSKDLGVILVGSLRNSSSTGRMQLFDQTGSIDVVIPDLPLDIDANSIYQVKDYTLVIEGMPVQKKFISSSGNGFLSCRNIFQHSQIQNELNGLTVYIQFSLKYSICLNLLFCTPVVKNNTFLESSVVFHLLFLTHKFPAFHEDGQVISDISSAFAEALFLPYDLIIIEEIRNEDGHPVEFSGSGMNAEVRLLRYADWFARRWWPEKSCGAHVSCEPSSTSHGIDEIKSSRIPCLLSLGNKSFQGFLVPCNLFCENSRKPVISVGGQSAKKFMLEFMADAFNSYQSLYVGAYYILKEGSQSNNACHAEYAKYGKVTIISKKSLLRFSFCPCVIEDKKECQHNKSSGGSLVGTIGRLCHNTQNEIFFNQSCNHFNGNLDIHQLHFSSQHMELSSFIKDFQNVRSVNPNFSPSETLSVTSCIQTMKKTSLRLAGTVKMESRLFEGNIISLRGDVLDVHFFHPNYSNRSYRDGTVTNICQGVNSVCIHVYENDHMIKIQGNIGKHAYPLGMGAGANVTFYRLLLKCNSNRWCKLTLTPASFLVVNSIKEVGNNPKSICLPHLRSDSIKEHLLCMRPFELMLQSSQHTAHSAVRIRCRVDQILILILEKKNYGPKKRPVEIPLAGFLMGDGSSICCCWADAERAEILLRLHESLFRSSVTAIYKRRGFGNFSHTINYHLDKILKKHHTVTIKNYGAIGDPKFADISFSVNSSKRFGSSEENFLKSIIFYACRGPVFDVVGTVIDLNAPGWSRLFSEQEGIKSLNVQNLWVTEVGPVNILGTTRSLLHELLPTAV